MDYLSEAAEASMIKSNATNAQLLKNLVFLRKGTE